VVPLKGENVYLKTCIGCGVQFESAKFTQKRCNRSCRPKRGERTTESQHGARKSKQLKHDIEFIAVDGEGVDADEWVQEWVDQGEGYAEEVTRKVPGHHYVLLSVGDQTLHKDGAILTHREIFPFLYEQFEANPNAAFVGYFLGYDFAQWLKSLSGFAAWSLLHKDGIARRQPTNEEIPFPWPVRSDGWEFDILGNKRFKLRPHVPMAQRPEVIVNHKDGTMTVKKVHPHKWMYICDTGAFFQSSFMKAIDPKDWEHPIVTDAEYAILELGKAHRSCRPDACSEGLPVSECPGAFGPEMIRYNLLENAVLPRLLEQVNLGFVGDNIRLPKQKWFGPGQAAQLWLGLVECPTNKTISEVVPDYAIDAARASYYGGWFEIFAHGVIPGNTFAYDINSAYPTAIAQLPCLLHGDWSAGKGRPRKLRDGSLRLIYATVDGCNPIIGAMPHRRPDGTILRPQRTAGWYWQSEVDAAIRAGVVSKVSITQWVDYRPCGCPPPLRAIAELYEGRLQVGKNSPFGKSKKLVYNSAYGKLAQSIGSPRFANAIYASLITSHCRAMILDAIATHPDGTQAVAMVATDSVTFYSPHPTLDIHATRLGAWDVTEHTNLSLMMPGLYWDDKSRAMVREGKAPRVKSRGVPAKDLAKFIDDIDAQWARMLTNSTPDVWPAIDIPIEFGMVSAKLAASQDRWEDCGRVVHDGNRHLEANPLSKRSGVYEDRSIRPGHSVIRSTPYRQVDGELRSTPYDKAFGQGGASDWRERDITENLITPDGTVDDSIHAVLPG